MSKRIFVIMCCFTILCATLPIAVRVGATPTTTTPFPGFSYTFSPAGTVTGQYMMYSNMDLFLLGRYVPQFSNAYANMITVTTGTELHMTVDPRYFDTSERNLMLGLNGVSWQDTHEPITLADVQSGIRGGLSFGTSASISLQFSWDGSFSQIYTRDSMIFRRGEEGSPFSYETNNRDVPVSMTVILDVPGIFVLTWPSSNWPAYWNGGIWINVTADGQPAPPPTPPTTHEGNGVYVNGQRLATPIPPVNYNGTLLVPLRAIGEALGAGFLWDSPTQTIVMHKGEYPTRTIVTMSIGNTRAHETFNYEYQPDHTLDVPPMIVDGHTLVPLRFIAEIFGATVRWEAPNAIITTN